MTGEPVGDDREELLEIVRDLRATLDVEATTAAAAEAPPLELPDPPTAATGCKPSRDAQLPVASGETGELRDVRQELGDCHRCNLAETRTHLVFGQGSPRAEIVFVGEAPGFEEDRRGEPFVGPAGQMLDAMIANVLRMERSDVYICNVLKCRPPRNRNPQPSEVASCTPFLERQLAAIGPCVVVALGRFAAQYLLGSSGSVGSFRGASRDRADGTAVVVTYHPAYLLRNPEDKRKAMDDLMLIRRTYESLTGKTLPEVRRRGRG